MWGDRSVLRGGASAWITYRQAYPGDVVWEDHKGIVHYIIGEYLAEAIGDSTDGYGDSFDVLCLSPGLKAALYYAESEEGVNVEDDYAPEVTCRSCLNRAG